MSGELIKDAVPVTFETFLVPSVGPDGQTAPYEFDEQKNPALVASMIQKIENNVMQFGTIERFVEVFSNELAACREAAEKNVRVYEARRRQMGFIVEYMKKNATAKDGLVDR